MTTSRRSRSPPALYQGCMDACRALQAFWTSLPRLWVLFSALVLLLQQHVEGQSVVFTATPPPFTSNTSAAFRFSLVAAQGGDPCAAASQCSIQCKLDQGTFLDCRGRAASYVNLLDGSHSFSVSVTTNSGVRFSNAYTWAVDTVPPTATVDAGPLYTNAVNITVLVKFSENCSGDGGFQCSTASLCDLLVYGPGMVLPPTLKVLTPGLEYSIQVALSTLTATGKVTIATGRRFCTDAAGNPYQRSSHSSAVVRFGRTQPTVNLWTAIRNSQVVVRDQARTIQATNDLTDLKIYLDFSEPVLSTAAELQSLLNLTSGILIPTHRNSRGNRRFGFLLTLNDTRVAVVTVTLPGNMTFSRYGTPVVETASISFLYDIKRPQVQLSTTARVHTQNRLLPVVIQFTKPVFSFDASRVHLSGGIMRSFNEISKTTYALVVSAMESKIVKVSVAENQTLDVAGNPNTASSVLQVQHYTTPEVSVALYSFITAGLLGTALASGALAVSSTNLAAAGALSSRGAAAVGTDPSRNLLGMAGHMQILALSDFLAVSLPIEYSETVKGLRWLIPHVNTPWQKNDDVNVTKFGTDVQTDFAASIRRRSLLMVNPTPLQHSEPQHRSAEFAQRLISQRHIQSDVKCASSRGQHSSSNCPSCAYVKELFPLKRADEDDRFHDLAPERRRRLGANGTEFGPSLLAGEYETYFLNQPASLQNLKDELNASKYTGWRDFERNVFWLAVVMGGVILLHILTLLFLRWRTKALLHGALSLPRFELFLLILALPAICQASAFVIRGGTTPGIVVGALLLAVPALFLFSVALFLIYAIYLGRLVQYKELRPQLQRDGTPPPPPTRKPFSLLVGKGYQGKWVRKEGLGAGFIPRFGILFEDRKGPPCLVTMIDDTNSRPKGIGRNGLRQTAHTMNSDDEGDEAPVSWSYKVLGCVQSAYILADLCRRIALGVIFGAYPPSDQSWVQVSLVFAITVAQFLYLVAAKPFQRRGVQLVETVSLLCEIGVFGAALALLAGGRPQDDHFGVGVFMLALLVLSFVAQSANEWFALTRQLLHLSNTEEISPKLALKEFAVGLILPLIPPRRWAQLIAPQGGAAPHAADLRPGPSSAAAQANAEPDMGPSTAGQRGSPLGSPRTATGAPGSNPTATNPGGASPSAEYWPGEDLQQWRRQNSLERKRREHDLGGLATTEEIFMVDPSAAQNPADAPSTSGVSNSRSRQRRSWNGSNPNRIHSSDALSETPSDADFTPDRSQELVHSGEFAGPPLSMSSRNLEVRAT